MTTSEWIKKNTFHCPHLEARITPTQCKMNRNNAKTNGTHDKTVHPCVSCEKEESYKEYMGDIYIPEYETNSDVSGVDGVGVEKSTHAYENEHKEHKEHKEEQNYMNGLEDCDIYNPKQRLGKDFISIYVNMTAAFSASLKDKFQVLYNGLIIGYNKENDVLKLKMLPECVSGAQKMYKSNNNFHIEGAANKWGLADRLKGKRFEAEFIDNHIIIVYLSRELEYE